MKNLRILGIATIILCLAMPIFAGGSGESSMEEVPVIGISKIVAHPALDGVEQGIQDELAALGVEAEYDLQNANGDMSLANSIAQKFKTDGVAIAVGIATPTSQALVNTITDSPVIYTAVTDPIDAGLVSSADKGEANVTGFSDLTPVKEQIEFLLALKPDTKVLGHVYTGGEANAVNLANVAKEVAGDLGLEFVEVTVTSSAEVQTATQSIVDRVDAIYVSTDNTVVSALNALVAVARDAGVPVMSADPSSAEGIEVLAAWGFDYYKMGRATGRLIKEILDGASTTDFGIQYMTDPSDVNLLINLDVAEFLGLTVPQDLIDAAAILVEDGVMVTK